MAIYARPDAIELSPEGRRTWLARYGITPHAYQGGGCPSPRGYYRCEALTGHAGKRAVCGLNRSHIAHDADIR